MENCDLTVAEFVESLRAEEIVTAKLKKLATKSEKALAQIKAIRDFFQANNLFIFRRNVTEDGTWVEISNHRVLFANGLPVRAESFNKDKLAWGLPVRAESFNKDKLAWIAEDGNLFPAWPLFPKGAQASPEALAQFKKDRKTNPKLRLENFIKMAFFNALNTFDLETKALAAADFPAAAGFFRFDQSNNGPVIKAIHDLVDKRLLHLAGVLKLETLHGFMAGLGRRPDILLPFYDQARAAAPLVYAHLTLNSRKFHNEDTVLGLAELAWTIPVPADNVLGYFKNTIFKLSDSEWRWLLKRTYAQTIWFSPEPNIALDLVRRFSALNVDFPASVYFELQNRGTCIQQLVKAPDRVIRAVAEGALRAKKHGVLTSFCTQKDPKKPRLLTVTRTNMPSVTLPPKLVKKTMKPFMAYSFTKKLGDVIGDFVGTGAAAWYIRKMIDTDALVAMLLPNFEETANAAFGKWMTGLGKTLDWDFLVAQSELWHQKWGPRYATLARTIQSEVEMLRRAKTWQSGIESVEIGDYVVTALNCGRALEQEGKQMHHCVWGTGYMTECLEGRSRIYHVAHKTTLNDVSTLQLCRAENKDESAWYLGQNKAIANIKPTSGLLAATNQFLPMFKAQWVELQKELVSQKLANSPAVEEQKAA